MNKKLKATDTIKLKGVLTGKENVYTKQKNEKYTHKSVLYLFGWKEEFDEEIDLDKIEMLANSNLYELIEGEWEEENVQEEKQNNEDTYRVKKENIVQDEPVRSKEVYEYIKKQNEKPSVIDKYSEKNNKNTVTGLDILRDLRDNQENSKYWNCKLKNVSKKYSEYDKVVKNGTVYVSLLKKENLSTKGYSRFIDEEFEPEFEREWKRISTQQLFDIITNFETDKYNFKRIDKDGYESVGNDLLGKTEIVDIPKYKWYIQEK